MYTNTQIYTYIHTCPSLTPAYLWTIRTYPYQQVVRVTICEDIYGIHTCNDMYTSVLHNCNNYCEIILLYNQQNDMHTALLCCIHMECHKVAG